MADPEGRTVGAPPPPRPRSGSQKTKNDHISSAIWSWMRHLRPQITKFSGGASIRTPLEHIYYKCQLWCVKILAKNRRPPVWQLLDPPLPPTWICGFMLWRTTSSEWILGLLTPPEHIYYKCQLWCVKIIAKNRRPMSGNCWIRHCPRTEFVGLCSDAQLQVSEY